MSSAARRDLMNPTETHNNEGITNALSFKTCDQCTMALERNKSRRSWPPSPCPPHPPVIAFAYYCTSFCMLLYGLTSHICVYMTDIFGSNLEKPLAFTRDAALDWLSVRCPLDHSRDSVLSKGTPLHRTSCHHPVPSTARRSHD